MRRKLDLPSEAEEEAINRGIAADPDNPEMGEEFFETARPARDVLPADLYAELVGAPDRSEVARPKSPTPKPSRRHARK